MTAIFDPFNDRLSRDIRNSLSTALIAELSGGDPSAVSREASRWLAGNPARPYRDYIQAAQTDYRKAMVQIASLRIRDPRAQAVVLWNRALFFELHELLETIWLDTSGNERTALKGLIQAAGAYVHSRRGKHAAALKLASRARANLETGKEYLEFIENLHELILALEQPGQAPRLCLGALPDRSAVQGPAG